MRKLVKSLLTLVVFVIVLPLLMVGFCELHEFRPYLASMRTIHSNMAPGDNEPPQNVQDFLWKVEGEAVDRLDARDLLAETKHPQKMLEWHFDSAIWDAFLPLHFTKKERIAFYCHYLRYENGEGLTGASQFYFAKTPEQLNLDELAAIVAVSRSPRGNSPSRHPDQFQAAKKQILDIYARVQ